MKENEKANGRFWVPRNRCDMYADERVKVGNKDIVVFITEDTNMNVGWGRMSYEIYDNFLRYSKNFYPLLFQTHHKKNAVVSEIYLERKKGVWRDLHKSIINALRMYVYLKKMGLLKRRCVIQVIAEKHILEGFLLSLMLKSPLYLSLIGTASVRNLRLPFLGMLYRYIYNRSYLWAISKHTANKNKSFLRKSKDIRVIYLGISVNNDFTFDKKKYVEYRKYLSKKYGISLSHKDIVFLTVGPIKPRKGQTHFICYFRYLMSKIPSKKFKYVIIGRVHDAPYYGLLRSFIESQSLSKYVFHISDHIPQEDLEKFYYVSNFFVMLSSDLNRDFEGFGLVYVESMFYGNILIGYENTTFDEIIFPYKVTLSKHLVKDNFKLVLRAVSSYDGKESSFVDLCRKYANQYNWIKTFKELEKYYKQSL